ncbi:hypothetical protein V8C34DRAFT_153254 [Trichoderma compactum]
MRTPTTSMHQLFTDNAQRKGAAARAGLRMWLFQNQQGEFQGSYAYAHSGISSDALQSLFDVLTCNLRTCLNIGTCRKTRRILWYHCSIRAISPTDSAPCCTYSVLDLDKALLSDEHACLGTGSTVSIAVGFVAIPLESWRRGAFPPRNFSWATSLWRLMERRRRNQGIPSGTQPPGRRPEATSARRSSLITVDHTPPRASRGVE